MPLKMSIFVGGKTSPRYYYSNCESTPRHQQANFEIEDFTSFNHFTFKKNNQGGGGRTQSATGDGGTRQGEEAATAQVFLTLMMWTKIHLV